MVKKGGKDDDTGLFVWKVDGEVDANVDRGTIEISLGLAEESQVPEEGVVIDKSTLDW